MADDQTILAELVAQFPALKDKARVQRARRLVAEVPYADFAPVFDHLIKRQGFVILCTITGLDLGADLGLIYHLAREDGAVLNLMTAVPKDRPVVQSVMNYFPAAETYEREVVDLLGFDVRGLPPGPRYPLPDIWPAGQFPLRKDWNAEMLEQALPKPQEAHDA